jgi:hypothetical protein
MNEKPALGFFLSGHPYHAYAAELGPSSSAAWASSNRNASRCCWPAW